MCPQPDVWETVAYITELYIFSISYSSLWKSKTLLLQSKSNDVMK